MSRKPKYLMGEHFQSIHAFWSWLGFIFLIIYLLWVMYGLIASANCTAMILDFCDLGKILVSFPWILIFAPKAGLEGGTLLNLVVAVSIVFNAVTIYLVGMGLQKVFSMKSKSSQKE